MGDESRKIAEQKIDVHNVNASCCASPACDRGGRDLVAAPTIH
jgi:uncharacterized Fe-S cluster protein YjdI